VHSAGKGFPAIFFVAFPLLREEIGCLKRVDSGGVVAASVRPRPANIFIDFWHRTVVFPGHLSALINDLNSRIESV
jgi:hypothetical protein